MRISLFLPDFGAYEERIRAYMKGTEDAEKVVVFTHHTSRESPLVANGMPDNWEVHYLPRMRKLFLSPWINGRMVALARERRIDIVHDHFYYLCSSFKQLKALPHAPILVESIYSYSRQWLVENRWKASAWSLAADKSRLRNLPGERRSLISADYVVLQSEALVGAITAHYRKIGAKFLFLGNAVDHLLFRSGKECREKFDIPAGAIAVLSVGYVGRHKGADVAIRAFANAYRKESRLFLVIVGSFPWSEESPLVALVEELGLADRVSFLGRVGHGDLQDLYRSVDMFILASYQEGMPRVVLEAMSSGLPVVASNLPGVHAIDPGGKCIVLVPSGDSERFAEALLRVAGEPEERRNRGLEGRAIIEARHTIEKVGMTIAEMYQSIMRERI